MHQHIVKTLTFTALFSVFTLMSACESNDKDKDTSVSSSSSSASSGLIDLELNLGNVQVHFPPAVVSTQDANIIVRGIVEDTANVAQLSINGTNVSSTDALNTWQVEIALEWGENTLILSQEDSTGLTTEVTSLTVSREAILTSPKVMAVNDANNQLLVWDKQLKSLVSVDITSGQKSILSPNTLGTPNIIENPREITLDSERNRALLYQATPQTADEATIVAIDLATGEQSTVELNNIESVKELNLPYTMIVEGSTAYIADVEAVLLDANNNRVSTESESTGFRPTGILFTVDLTTGEKSILSNYGTPDTLSYFESITSMSTSVESDYIYAIDYNTTLELNFIYKINKTSGQRTLLTPHNIVDGEDGEKEDDYLSLVKPKSIQLNYASQELYILDSNQIINVNLADNTYAILSSTIVPAGSDYRLLKAESTSLSNNILYVVDDAFDYILAIDTATGLKTQIAGTGKDNPKALSNFLAATDVTLDAKNNRVLNVDKLLSTLTSVDLTSADKTTVTSYPEDAEAATKPYLSYPIASSLNQTKNELLILDNYNQRAGATISSAAPRLFTVDLDTNTLSEKLFFGSTGVTLYDLAFHEGAQTAYTVENNYIRKIDLSGDEADSSVLSHNTHPNANYPFKGIKSLAVDYTHNRLLVTDTAQNAVIAVSLADGARTAFSNSGHPVNGGPELVQPKAIVVDEIRNRALVLDSTLDAVLAIDLETGIREVIIENVADSHNKLYSPQDIDLHPVFNYLVLIDDATDILMAVDLVTNQKVMISR